jgi:nuclear pore complex protein Nup188
MRKSPANLIESLASNAIDGTHAFETLSNLAMLFGNTSTTRYHKDLGSRVRILILDLIGKAGVIGGVGYIPEVVSTLLSSLTGGQSYWDVADASRLYQLLDPSAAFLEDDDIVPYLLLSARSRYPFESMPFLKIASAVGSCTALFSGESKKSILNFLEIIPAFTYALPDGFLAYETTHEEDNNNTIRLTETVALFVPRLKLLRNVQNQGSEIQKIDPDFSILAGTYGRMVSESSPRVAHWFHSFSGFKYFGNLLETFMAASDHIDATIGDVADRDSVTEIISLFAVILLSLSKSENQIDAKNKAFEVLETASLGLGEERDIITVVFEIFEEELQKQSTYTGSDVPTELLVSCVQFIHGVIKVLPGRVWPLLGRSGLLNYGSGSGKLSSIVSGVELVSGRYDFLLSCTALYEALVEDFVTHAVVRRSKAKTATRFDARTAPATEVPTQVLSRVLLSFTRYLVDVLESSCSWKFVDTNDRRRLRRNITRTFNNVLHNTYGLDNSSDEPDSTSTKPDKLKSSLSTKSDAKPEETSKMMAALEPAALLILDSFLSSSSGSLRFQPLMEVYYDGFGTAESAFYVNESRLCCEQVTTALTFARILLRVGTLLNRPSSYLEGQLFKASPLIVRLFASNDSYRVPVLSLFEALITAASNHTAEPPSLLGHLGSRTSRNFLHILSDLDKPLSRKEHCYAIMQFVAKVVSCRQQWSANYLLTGRPPQATLRASTPNKELAPLDKPFVNTALNTFPDMDALLQNHGLDYLQFVALAHNFSPWATYSSERYTDFIKYITKLAGSLRPLQPTLAAKEDASMPSYQTKVAAYIAEILAMHLFHLRQLGQPSPSNSLLDSLNYFSRFAVSPPNYNSSLHANLTRNFESQYGCKLLDFQKSSLDTPELGQDYFYDLALADKLLSFDQAWQRRGGFRAEVAIANINLSLVDAQVVCLVLPPPGTVLTAI